MKVAVTFRHMSPSDPLKTHAMEKIQRLKKYFKEDAESHVVLSVEKHMHKAELNLTVHGINVRGQEASGDMYNSIDRAIERIEKQLRRYHNKLVTARPREGARRKLKYQLVEGISEEIETAAADHLPSIVETKEIDARPMMLDEAVMQMDLMHDDVLVFMNTKTEQLNILYRKAGNKYGLIEAS